MPYEYSVNATTTTWGSSSGLTPIIVGLCVMIICGMFLLLLAYRPFFTWLWRKIGKAIYVIKSFIVGIAVYFGGRGIYSGTRILFKAGATYLTLNDVITGFVYFIGLTLLGMIAMYVGKRIYANYLTIKPKLEIKEEVKEEAKEEAN